MNKEKKNKIKSPFKAGRGEREREMMVNGYKVFINNLLSSIT
jgi:hypothetical protein